MNMRDRTNILHVIFLAVLLTIIVCAIAFAQQPAPPPPTDLEIEQARAVMLEGQLRYFVDLLRKSEAEKGQQKRDADALAVWWASYVAGLAPEGEKK